MASGDPGAVQFGDEIHRVGEEFQIGVRCRQLVTDFRFGVCDAD